MDWAEVVKTVVGPLVGGAIALSAIWIKESFDRRRALQTWYEDQYIRGGIDPLISYFMTMHFALFEYENDDWAPKELIHMPIEALTRVQTVLRTEVFTAMLPTLYMHAAATNALLRRLRATSTQLSKWTKVL